MRLPSPSTIGSFVCRPNARHKQASLHVCGDSWWCQGAAAAKNLAMDKAALVGAIDSVHTDWFSLIDDLGTDGLERPAVVGEWRVRDVIAHANCWDRWQLV